MENTATFLIALGNQPREYERLARWLVAEPTGFFIGERMNDLALFGEKTVTTKELAEELEISESSVKRAVEKLRPVLGGVTKNNQGGYLFNEKQATLIKQEIQKHHNLASRQIDSVSTDYEMELMTQKVLAYHVQKANEYKVRAELAEQKNSLLMHTSKTYTASEIAKELGLPSAQKLNLILEERGIQFKRNGTWIPIAKYSGSGFYEIKQDVLDNGAVIYSSRFTQKGRDFVLNLIKNA